MSSVDVIIVLLSNVAFDDKSKYSDVRFPCWVVFNFCYPNHGKSKPCASGIGIYPDFQLKFQQMLANTSGRDSVHDL